MKTVALFALAVVALLAGCRSVYSVDSGEPQAELVAFVRPADYSILNLWLELTVRNRGNQGFFSWGDASRDMTLYASVDFLDAADGNRLVLSVPKRAVPLPLGRAVHLRWEATDSRATTARVVFSE